MLKNKKINSTYMVGEAYQKSFQGLEEIGLRRQKINLQKAEEL